MTRRMGTAVLALALWSAFGSALAAVPGLVNYQGILTDGSGIPQVSGPFSVTFSIYDDASATNPAIWTEIQSIMTDSEGRFNVLLGSVTALDEGVFSGSDRWLGVTVSPDLAGLLPRTRIATVAYAFRPATVDGAAGGQISGELAISSGNLSLENSAPTTGNIIKAGSRFIHNSGSDNTFVGISAGNLMISGSGNTASGSSALRDIMSGNYNTANGAYALLSNTLGTGNTASGADALGNNSTGNENTAIGMDALQRQEHGNENTAVGVRALYKNEGSANTAIGINALENNTSGVNNTGGGANALWSNTGGSENTALGRGALYSNTGGSWNTAIGRIALYGNATGNHNTAVGFSALSSGTSGARNTAIGYEALRDNGTGSDNTAIGYLANVSTGNLTNATAIGQGAIVNASNKIRLGNPSVTVLECQVGLTVISDRNEKENFRRLDGDEILAKVCGIPVSSWNLKGHDPQQFRHYGPMAQDFFAAFGSDGAGTVGSPTTINSGDMAGILMIAVQALEKRNQELELTVAEMKSRLEQLEGR